MVAAIVTAFHKELKGLMTNLVKLQPGDAVVARTQKRLVLACDITPLQIVEWTGATIFTYMDSVYSDDPEEWSKFLDPETSLFDAPLGENTQATNQEDAKYLISRVQDIVRPMSEADRRSYIERVRRLLDLYLDYRETIAGEK